MFKLFKRELKSLILKPISAVAFALSFLVPAIIFAVLLSMGADSAETQDLEAVYAGFENLVSIVAIFFALVIPAVVIYAVRAERKEKNFNFLISLPISRTSIVRAKFLSLVAYFVLPLGIMALYPLVFSAYGEVNYLQCYLALLMLALFVIFLVAFSFMVAVKKHSVIVASIITYSAIVLSYAVGVFSALVRFLPFGTSFNVALDEILSELSIFKKLDKSVLELFYWSDVIFFIVGIIVFVSIASLSYGKEFLRNEKKPRSKKRVAVICSSFILVLCIAFVPILLPYSVSALDVSREDLYSHDEKLDNFFDSVNEDITIYLINPYSGNEELYNVILRTAERSDRINLEIVDSLKDTEILEKYGLPTDNSTNSLNALSYAMVIQSGKRWRFVNQEDYYVFSNGESYLSVSDYQTNYEYLNYIISNLYPVMDQLSESQLQTLQKAMTMLEELVMKWTTHLCVESVIAESVEYVTVDIVPKVYFLSGHGEEGTSVNPYDFVKNPQIPKDANVVVINSPSEDYSLEEVEILNKYVDNGGKLYVLVDEENYSMTNFSNLLKRYGLTFEKSVITAKDTAVIDVDVNKNHSAFTSSSASVIKMTGASKITTEGTKYKYDTILSYTETVGEGETATTATYPIAVSASENGKNRVVLLTGAKTFNGTSEGLGIEEDALERSGTILTSSISWLFEPFSSKLPEVTPKDFQKSPYVTTTGDVIKNVIIFAVVIPAAALLSALVYNLSRNLRSKRGKNGNSEIY